MKGASLIVNCIVIVRVLLASDTGNVLGCQECNCYLHEEVLTADCSNRNLTIIPSSIPDEVNALILSENYICHINDTTFSRFTNLTTLDISHNNIENIDQNAFHTLYTLESLNVGNSLILQTLFIKPSLFKPLQNLKTLFMNRINTTTGIIDKYPVSALQELVSLETLCIDGLFGSPLEGFEKLKKLHYISFSGHNGFCNMSILSDVALSSLSRVETLNISNCNLYEIDPNAFKPLPYLKVLDLSQNPCLYMKGVENATYGLQNSKYIRKLYFNDIVDAFAICIEVGDTLFENMQNTSLIEFHFDRNRIERFSCTTFEIFPKNLTLVSLRGNRFTYGPYLRLIKQLIGLEELDLSGELNYLVTPNTQLNSCHGRCVPSNTCKCPYPSASNANFFSHLALTEGMPIPLPPNLTRLSLKYRYLPYVIENLHFQNNSLKHLDIAYNIFTCWRGNIRGLEGLEYIDASHNSIYHISENFLTNFPSLKTLNMTANILKTVLENDIDGVILKGLTNLTELNLAENILQKLPSRVFDGLPLLQVLNLSHNYLREFNSNIIHMKDLHTVDISHNDIRWIRHPIQQQFDQLAENHTVILKLDHNSFDCTCENLIFWSWLKDSKKSTGNLSSFNCINTNGDVEHFSHLEDILEMLQEKCYNHLSLYIASTSATIVSLALMLLSVGYRYRWKMRYWYYAARLRYNTTQHNHFDEFEFDAFVSFAEEDRDFVVSELMEKLETEAGLRLNIHQRDFTAGRPIASNVIEAVKNSRKTLLILSEHFIQSYWCIYELQMANMESVTTGRDVILILRTGDIPVKDIPTEILYHFQTDSYLDYQQNEDTSLFWRTLANSIKI